MIYPISALFFSLIKKNFFVLRTLRYIHHTILQVSKLSLWPHLRQKKLPRRQAQVTEKLQNQRWGGGLPFPHPAEIHGNGPRGSILPADVMGAIG